MHGHFHAKHAVQAAEKAGAGHVHEWNSARSVACQSLQSRISARRAGMCAKRTEQRVDVRALAAAAVQRIGEHLAHYLLVLREIPRD